MKVRTIIVIVLGIVLILLYVVARPKHLAILGVNHDLVRPAMSSMEIDDEKVLILSRPIYDVPLIPTVVRQEFNYKTLEVRTIDVINSLSFLVQGKKAVFAISDKSIETYNNVLRQFLKIYRFPSHYLIKKALRGVDNNLVILANDGSKDIALLFDPDKKQIVDSKDIVNDSCTSIIATNSAVLAVRPLLKNEDGKMKLFLDFSELFNQNHRHFLINTHLFKRLSSCPVFVQLKKPNSFLYYSYESTLNNSESDQIGIIDFDNNAFTDLSSISKVGKSYTDLTLVGDDLVMFSGGYKKSSMLDTCFNDYGLLELLDIKQKRFRKSFLFNYPRSGHVTARLHNKDILFIGGEQKYDCNSGVPNFNYEQNIELLRTE